MTSEVFARIYALVEAIPEGKVATYGQLARLAGVATPRVVGFAMAAAPEGLPWHRVVNSQGKISLRREGGESEQRKRLHAEGLKFDRLGRLDLARDGWEGPSWAWLAAAGFDPETALRPAARSGGRAAGGGARRTGGRTRR